VSPLPSCAASRTKPHPLHLPAAERVGGTPEAEVAQTDFFEEGEAAKRLLERGLGDDGVAPAEVHLAERLDRLGDAQVEQRRDRHLVDCHATRQGRQACLLALITQAFLDGAFASATTPALLDDFAAPLACRALPLPCVEGEEPRVELRVATPAVRARLLARELHLVLARDGPGSPAADLERLFEQQQELGALASGPADHELHVVLDVAVELHSWLEPPKLPVDARFAETVLHRFLEQLSVNALAAAHHWGEQREFFGSEAALYVVNELSRRACRDRHLAIHAMQHADAGPNQTQVVRDLRHRRDGRIGPGPRHPLLE